MSLYAYRVFQTVVQEKSFVRAAERLQLTPSAVSHTIAKIEENAGMTLLIREKRGVTLTEAGKQIYQYIKDILATEDMLEKRVAQIKGAESGPVRLGMIESVAVNWLSGLLTRYQNGRPGVQVTVQEAGYSTLIQALLAHELDLAIVSHTAVTKNTSRPLQFIPLYEDRLVCVVPKYSLYAAKEVMPLETLSGLPVILPQGGDEADVVLYLQQHDVHPQIVGHAAACVPLLEMVTCGLGCGVTPELSVTHFGYEEEIATLALVPFAARSLGIITQEPRFLSPAVRQLIAAIQDYVWNHFTI